MLKVFLNRLPLYDTPWGGGNMWCQAFHKHSKEFGITVTDHIQDCDVVLLVGLDRGDTGIGLDEAMFYKTFHRDVSIVTRVNENDARKNTCGVDSLMLRAISSSRCVIFVSEWLKGYYLDNVFANGSLKHQIECSHVVHNGVDESIFKKSTEKFDNAKTNIVTHHWSNNSLKGFDIYNELDRFVEENRDRFSFTYIGRDQGTFKNTNVIKPLHGERLGKELARYDVYVSASRFDPGPNHIVEGISCGLPTYVHKDGGGSVEIAGLDHVYDDWINLKQLLRNGKFTSNATELLSWRECIKRYCEFMLATCT
jgi:glycosyltransferase involved in cell wall biosynthesis